MSGATGRTPVLRNRPADRRLAFDGYVIVPLLEPDEVVHLRERYAALVPDDDRGLTIDFMRSDRGILHEVANLLAPMWERHLAELFVDHRPVISTFVVKYPGPGSEMVLHNEPTFVDSAQPTTYNVWIPLVDVRPHPPNGTLELVLGSQNLRFGLTGFNTPLLFRPFEGYLREHATALRVAAGSAVVYDTRMLHVSGPNLTTDVRPAVAAAFAPRAMPLVHVVASGRRGRRIHRVNERFFLDAHPSDASDLLDGSFAVVREVEEGWQLTPQEVADALGTGDLPVARVVVPHEVLGDDQADQLPHLDTTEWTGGPVPLEEVEDVGVSAVDLGLGVEGAAGLQVVSCDGSVAVVPLGRRADDKVPATVPEQVRSLTTRTGTSVLAVVDAGARLTLRGRDHKRYGALVYDCPVVNAGIRSPEGVAQLDVGLRVGLRGPGPFTIWNDGPGSAWVVLTRTGWWRQAWRRWITREGRPWSS